MTKLDPTRSHEDRSREKPVPSHPSAPVTPDPAPAPPALSSESLEMGSGEALLEEEAPPRYNDYAAKLISPRRRKTAQETKSTLRRLPATQRQQKQRMQLLLGALMVSVVGWVVFTAGRTHVEPLTVLTLRDLPRSEAVVAVTARPPSLFVQVDGQSWSRLNSTEQVDLVERTGAAAQSAGYSGVLFRTTAGTSVAQWMSASGARVFELRESAS